MKFENRRIQYAEVSPYLFDQQGDKLNREFISFWNLYQSIKKKGIIEPLSAVKYANGKYKILGGTRRLSIAKHLGIKKIPVIIVENKSNFKLLENAKELKNKDDIRKCYKSPITFIEGKDLIVTNTTPIHNMNDDDYDYDNIKLVKGCIE